MHRVTKSGISWSLEDPAIESLLGPDLLSDERRPCWTRPFGNGAIFIKLFREKSLPGAVRNWLSPRGEKEYRIAVLLRALSVPVPRPLGFGKGRMCSFSIQEWVDGDDLLTLFRRFSPKRSDLLTLLSSLLLLLKKGMIRHNDLHLRNIMVSGTQPYIVDLHKSRVKSKFMLADELGNMCEALLPIYADMTEVERSQFFDLYGRRELRASAERELDRMRKEWVRSKKKRAFRTTSALREEGGKIVVRDAPVTTAGEPIEYLKQDRKTQVERHTDHVRKIYRNRRRLNRAWKNHVALEYRRIDVVPRAFSVKKASLRARGFIAMEDLGRKGMPLSRYLVERYGKLNRAESRGFIDRFSCFLLSLLRRSIGHRDLKPSNIFALEDGSFRLLDVEDMLFEPVSPDRLTTMLAQLNELVPLTVRLGDRFRFLKGVTDGLSFTRDERKVLFRAVRQKSEDLRNGVK